jgi:cytochrome c
MPPPSMVWVRTRKADSLRHKAMKMARPIWLQILIAVVVTLVALLLVRLHNASGATPAPESASAGRRLAEAWCTDCHSIEAATRAKSSPPDFTAIANRASTTALSLKVFFQTSHRNMPNLIITPAQAHDLVNFILSLKRD